MDRTKEPNGYHRRELAQDVEKPAPRTIRFVASDETVDRYGDVIAADGWQLKQFKKNRQFLWMHDHEAPIGEVTDVHVEGEQLLATARFATEGVSRRADELWALVEDGVLRAFSVGFTVGSERGKDYEPIFDDEERITGYRYLKPELLEISLVSVPANPNALAIARSRKVSDSLIRQALPLDASVRERQVEARIAIQAIRLRGIQVSAPR